MGKKKRSGAPLSHEEIWDDSALVQSWDDAVEEYEVYHSIHARGEDVEQVLNRAEEGGEDEEAGEPMDTETTAKASDKTLVSEAQPPAAAPAPAPAVPSALLGQVQDPALKNLMMSWYFAGYYTGLYEGQQQASSQNATTNAE